MSANLDIVGLGLIVIATARAKLHASYTYANNSAHTITNVRVCASSYTYCMREFDINARLLCACSSAKDNYADAHALWHARARGHHAECAHIYNVLNVSSKLQQCCRACHTSRGVPICSNPTTHIYTDQASPHTMLRHTPSDTCVWNP